jgi:hypothetical protein
MDPEVIVIGYNKDFSYNAGRVVVYEAMSDRIDYIRSKKQNFVLIPKFIHSGPSSLRKVHIERRMDLPIRNHKKRSSPFLHVQREPFYNSREIEVSTIPLCDVKGPFNTLFIHYGDIEDIIKSAGNKFYRFKEIFIHKNVPLTQRDNLLLERYLFFPQDSTEPYIHYISQKPQLKVKTFRYSRISDILYEPYESDTLFIICPDSYDKSKLPSLHNQEIVDDEIYIERENSRLSDIFIFSSVKNVKTLVQIILEKKITTTNKLSSHLNLKIFLKE